MGPSGGADLRFGVPQPDTGLYMMMRGQCTERECLITILFPPIPIPDPRFSLVLFISIPFPFPLVNGYSQPPPPLPFPYC